MTPRKKILIIPLFFLIAILFYYPFQWIRIFISVRFYPFMPLITPNVLALLSISLILLSYKRLLKLVNRKNQWALLSLAFLFFVPVMQSCFIQNYNFEYVAGGLFYASLLLFGILYHNQLKALFPKLASFLWITDLICVLCREQRILRLPSDGISHWLGLPGNRNWHATLIVITTPLFMYECDRILKKLNLSKKSLLAWRLALYIPILLVSVYGIYVADSKGADLALFASLSIVLFFGYKKFRVLFKSAHFKIAVVAAAIISAAALLALVNSRYFDNFLQGSVRHWLWGGTVSMIMDHPLRGVGNGLFESEFRGYLNPEYYLNKHAADHNNHPHNHFLYIASCFGLPFFLCWASIIGFLIFKGLSSLSKRSVLTKLLFFVFMAIFFHAQFDLVAARWPTNSLFVLLTGILWAKFWHKSKANSKNVKYLGFLCKAGFLFFLICAIFFAQRTFRAGVYYRASRIMIQQGKYQQALLPCNESIIIKPAPEAYYLNALNSFSQLKNPKLCWSYLSSMYANTPYKRYMRSTSLSGRCLFMLGRYEEALSFFIQSCREFPLSCANWNCRALTLDALGRHQEAVEARCMISNILKWKNLSRQDLPLLLGNPVWDVNAHKIPPELLYRNRKKK